MRNPKPQTEQVTPLALQAFPTRRVLKLVARVFQGGADLPPLRESHIGVLVLQRVLSGLLGFEEVLNDLASYHYRGTLLYLL